MPSFENQTAASDLIKDALGPPPLIKGESADEYRKLWLLFTAAYTPEALNDWLEVDGLVRKHWEQKRLRRSNAALIDATMTNALKNLLQPFQAAKVTMPGISDLSSIDANPAKIAHEYYSSNDETRRKARERVGSWGITDDQIVAEAMQLRAKELILFDRMDNYRTSAKRAHQKELDRRLEARQTTRAVLKGANAKRSRFLEPDARL